MKNLMPQLKNDEAILLMYVADELSPHDRAEVDRMLTLDDGLRRQLEELRRTMEVVDAAMNADGQGMAARADRCAEQTIAAMHRWQDAPPPLRLVPATERRKLPLPWWSYPVAAAASVLVAAAVFFANTEPTGMTDPLSRPMAQSIPDLLSSPVLADLSIMPLDPYAQYAMAEDLAATFDDSQQVFSSVLAESDMLNARREITALQELSQDKFASADWLW